MKHQTGIVLVSLLLFGGLAALAQDATVPTGPVDATTTLKTYLLALGGLMLLLIPLVKIFGAMTGFAEDRIGLFLGACFSALAHATPGFEAFHAPAEGVLGWIWAIAAGLLASATAEWTTKNILNPMLPNKIDVAFTKAGTGNGALVILVLVLVSTVACGPLFNPVTIQELHALQSKSEAATRCPEVLAREEARSDAMKDPVTLKHLRWLCDCYAAAVSETDEAMCRATIPAYTVYEETKQ